MERTRADKEGKRPRERATRHGGIDYIEGRRVVFLLVDFYGNRAMARAR